MEQGSEFWYGVAWSVTLTKVNFPSRNSTGNAPQGTDSSEEDADAE